MIGSVILVGLALAATPSDALDERIPVVARSGWRGFVPVESAFLDRVEASVHPSGRGALAMATHGRYGGASLWLVAEDGSLRELWRTGEDETLSKPVWSEAGDRFAVVLESAPRWVLDGPTPTLQFGGRLFLGAPDGARVSVPTLPDAARPLGFAGRNTLVATRYLRGDLPEERPYRIDLLTGAVAPILDEGGHVYSLAMFGSRIFFARTRDRVVTLPLPDQLVEVVEADVLGNIRILAVEVGGMPTGFALEDGVLSYESEGTRTVVALDLDGGTARRTPKAYPVASPQPLAAGQYLPMPYIHQVYDTPDEFNGHWACGPTSTVMAVQHFNRLDPWPVTVHVPSAHTSDFGAYIAYEYTAYGYTFNRVQPDPNGNPFKGAWGHCTENGGGMAWRMYDYASKHDLDWTFDYTATFAKLQASIDAGKPVPLSTNLTDAGHIVTVKGYTTSGNTVVNDPYGNKNTGYMNWAGETVQYTWATLKAKWFITLAGTVTPTTPPYRATWIAQDYPATMVGGTTAPASLTYRNDGTATWTGNTRLGTTEPRDRPSPFFTAGEWLNNHRLAAASSTAPGAQHTFSFTLSAPEVCEAQTYTEHFNLVEEGIAWFSDNGQGGPGDSTVWFRITVNPPPGACQDAGAPPGPDAAAPGPDAAQPPGEDAGQVVEPKEDAGPVWPDAGEPEPGEDAGEPEPGEDAGEPLPGLDAAEPAVPADAGAVLPPGRDAGGTAPVSTEVVGAGCGCAAGPSASPVAGVGALLALGLLGRRRLRPG